MYCMADIETQSSKCSQENKQSNIHFLCEILRILGLLVCYFVKLFTVSNRDSRYYMCSPQYTSPLFCFKPPA